MNKQIQRLMLFGITIFGFFTFACREPDKDKSNKNSGPTASARQPSESTLKMVSMLKAIADTASIEKYFYLNSARAGYYTAQIAQIADAAVKRPYRIQLAYELLSAGKSQEAIDEYTALIKESRDSGKEPEKFLLDYLAISCLRLGEQQNCCNKHNEESCIVPIQGKGIHHNQKGSRLAIETYQEILKKYPNDLGSVWLLNLAYMTVDEYPEKVPARWRIPPEEIASEIPFPKYTDVAVKLGLDVKGLSGGVCMEDFDKDGDLDLLCSSYGLRDQLKYFINNGNGTFADKTDDALLSGITSGLNLIHADYNNDGFTDVLVLRGGWLNEAGSHPNSLLKNNGDGTFNDVTIESGLLSFHPTQTAAWGDFNLDGWLDLFIGNESRDSIIHPCEMYVNNQNGTFTNLASSLNLDFTAFVKGAVWGDVNNDGWPDLYISILGQPNKLMLNKGGTDIRHWKFEDISKKAGVAEPIFSFPCWFWDYDNDGWQDIFVSGYDLPRISEAAYDYAAELLHKPSPAPTIHIYRNNHNLTFTDATSSLHMKKVCYAMGSNFGDLDNDGYQDCLLGTGAPDYRTVVPNRMFRNNNGKYFEEVTTAAGVGNVQKGHGVAFGDMDNDGDQDIYMVIGGAIEGDIYFNALYENPGTTNQWITIICEGEKSNKSAIGARLEVVVKTKENKRHHFNGSVGTGGSFGASSLQQELGLGEAMGIDSLIITWPDINHTKQIFTGIDVNQKIKIREGTPGYEKVVMKPFKLSGNKNN